MRKILVSLFAVAICMAASHDARAQADFGFKGVGGEIGLVSPENVNSTLGFGVFTNLGTIAPRWCMTAHLDYWGHSEDMAGVGTASVNDVGLKAHAVYEFPVTSTTVQPYAGGGLGLHFVHAKAEVPDQIIGGFLVPGFTVEDSQTKLGVDLGGGMRMPMGQQTQFVSEVWYGIVSDISQFSLKVGVEYRLGR